MGSDFTNPTGIAVSSACGIKGTDLLISNPDQGKSFVNLYGPPPDGKICPPPPNPPEIEAQHAVSVGDDGATVRAQINPRFWPDTSYYVEYGTGRCDEGGCEEKALFPGIQLGAGTVSTLVFTKGIFLGASEALQPDTTYHYRFVAQSRFDSEGNEVNEDGGPVYGEDPDGEGPKEATPEDGLERSFHTSPTPSAAKTDCPNQAFRTGASAPLPDCRAYELVSPVDKGNSDLLPPREGLDQASSDGEVATFASISAFAEPAAAPLYNQYISQRDSSSGWSTRSINAPRSTVGLAEHENLATRYKIFSEDLCNGWLLQDTDVPLVEGAPRGVSNIYRRGGLHAGCGTDEYQLQTTVFPPGYDPEVEKREQSLYYPQTQGFSADGSITVFRAPAVLNEDEGEGTCPDEQAPADEQEKQIFQVYLSDETPPGAAPRLVSVLPDGLASCTHSSVGTDQSFTGAFNSREDSLYHAVSGDGARIYWSATHGPIEHKGHYQWGNERSDPGTIYLRLNPESQQSAFLHGRAAGKGDLIGPAEGEGKIATNSAVITQLKVSSGAFAVGQEISDTSAGIPAGTKITEVNLAEGKLTLSAKATKGKTEDGLIGASSEVVSNANAEVGAFEVGQSITGAGIPAGTTITAIEGATLTLSAKATQSNAGASLSATSPCTEPQAACTLPVSEEGEALSGTNASRFLSAASDGSAAIFQSGGDLYEYDLAKALAGETATQLIAGEVKGILGTSADASSVYLLSDEELEGEGAQGKPNLYLYQRGVGTNFIATLSAGENLTIANSSAIEIEPYLHTARVSPDGSHAAFTSADPGLAQSVAEGYDNLDAESGRPDREVYLYDASAEGGEGKLICASCNPSGARPSGRLIGGSGNDVWVAASIPGWITSTHPGNALSADGDRLFFESFEALVGRDTNERGDVYEWERANSKEECLEEIGGERYVPSTNSCLSLISSGKGSADAEFVDASSDGRDVFFYTNASLLPQDPDFQDLYDAREGGGFPAPPAPPAECEGDACQNPPIIPEAQTPASAGTGPSGNLKPTKLHCAKSKRRVLRQGKERCVAKKRKSQAKKHNSRRAAK